VQKLEFLTAYENACESNEGGAFLRTEGLYSSQMTEWRRLRDAGVLAGKKAGESIGKLSADQAENARLRRRSQPMPPPLGGVPMSSPLPEAP
jgi:transposase